MSHFSKLLQAKLEGDSNAVGRLIEAIVETKTEEIEATVELLRSAIQGSPYEGRVYLAGGYVRDKVMGHEPKDVDVVVDGDINAGIECATFVARALGLSAPVTYPRFGTAQVTFKNGVQVEFVPPRSETYTAGSRKPEVASSTLALDASRRDLTINSLFQNLTTQELHDLTGRGMDDIKRGRIRTPIDADTIFAEDPLRILRVIRFAFKYKFEMGFELIRSIKRNAETLRTISGERVRDEVEKILVVTTPSKAVRLMQTTGVLRVVMPEVADLVGVTQNKYHTKDVFGHTMDVIDRTPQNVVVRLAALFHDIGKKVSRTDVNGKVQFIGHANTGEAIARDLMKRLKYSNEDIKRVTGIIGAHMDLKSAGATEPELRDPLLRKFVHKVGDLLEPALHVMHADNVSHAAPHDLPDQIDSIRRRLASWDLGKYITPQLPIDGNDVMALGAKGPLVGKIIDRVKEKYLEKDGIDRETALQIAKNMVRDLGKK